MIRPPRISSNHQASIAKAGTSWLPFAAACIAAVIIMAIVFPHSFGIVGVNPRPSEAQSTSQAQ